MGMEIYQLRSFVVLAEHLHFGRAAQALHVSQPALTKQIRRLEEEIGGALFERSSSETRLSSVGRDWLPRVRDLLARFDATAAEARRSTRGDAGSLRIGFGFHTLTLVPALVTNLRAAAPGVEITLRDMSSAEQEKELEAGALDIGFMRMPSNKTAGYIIRPVVEDRLALVTPAGAFPSGKLSLGRLREASWVSISRERSPGFFNHMLELCAAHGFHPRIVQEVHEFSTALGLVRAGMGVTMVPNSAWPDSMHGLDLHPLAEKQAAWKVFAVWRRDDSNPVLASLVKLLPAAKSASRNAADKQ